MTNYIHPKYVLDYIRNGRTVKLTSKTVAGYIKGKLGGDNYRDVGITKDPNGNVILFGTRDDPLH